MGNFTFYSISTVNKIAKHKNINLSTQKVLKPNFNSDLLNELIVDSIQDIKGKNVVKLDLRNLEEAPTDFFIICEGDSNTQVKAISDNISKRVKFEAAIYPSHVEGERTAQWILIDFFTTVVHVFYPSAREFYELESLWSDALFTEYANI